MRLPRMVWSQGLAHALLCAACIRWFDRKTGTVALNRWQSREPDGIRLMPRTGDLVRYPERGRGDAELRLFGSLSLPSPPMHPPRIHEPPPMQAATPGSAIGNTRVSA
jgi:hypothetical protein